MARKTADKIPFPGKYCRDCRHHYDEHSKALDGHMILCRCPYYTDGKWCKFMSDYACAKFTPV